MSGQGGTPFELVQRPPSDTWKIVDLINEADCILSKVEFFPVDLFENYQQVGYRGLHKRFNVSGSVVHTIRKVEPRELLTISQTADNSPSTSSPPSWQPLYPPTHTLHLSFWLPGHQERLEDTVLETAMRQTRVAEMVARWEAIGLFRSQEGRHSQTIEVHLCDTSRPLGRARAVKIIRDILGKSLENCAGVSLR